MNLSLIDVVFAVDLNLVLSSESNIFLRSSLVFLVIGGRYTVFGEELEGLSLNTIMKLLWLNHKKSLNNSEKIIFWSLWLQYFSLYVKINGKC